MKALADVALICVTHDPKGKNLKFYEKVSNVFREIYSNLFITVSEETDIKLQEKLMAGGFNVKVIAKKGAANARREAVNFALTGSDKHFHYCDFDRLLTWAIEYESELRRIPLYIEQFNYLIFGRTEEAFNTHPVEWIETEKITNKIFSLEFGQEVDITAGSSGFSRKSAEAIAKYSKDKMTDAEWPMIVHRIEKLKVGYKAVKGLLYEEEENGYARKISASERWLSRVKLCYIISESAVKTGKEN